jgi:6-phosphogluconolactonase
VSIISLSDAAAPQFDRWAEYSGLENPAYLSWDPMRNLLFAVSEAGSDPGAIHALELNAEDGIRPRSRSQGPGYDGCHISLSPDGSRLYAASYGAGRYDEYLVADDGTLELAVQFCFSGSGPNRSRQESPHAHQVLTSPWSRVRYVCDLGSDWVWMLDSRPDPGKPLDGGSLNVREALAAPAGYGPRHLTFDPEMRAAYILCELEPRILFVTIDAGDGTMTIAGEYDSSSPASESGNETAPAPAAIKLHPSGRTLAVSARFTDSIAVFAIERNPAARTAVLHSVGEFPCGGKTPRDIEFSPDGTLLLIGNQDSDTVTSLHFHPGTGLTEGSAGPSLAVGAPACIVSLE